MTVLQIHVYMYIIQVYMYSYDEYLNKLFSYLFFYLIYITFIYGTLFLLIRKQTQREEII